MPSGGLVLLTDSISGKLYRTIHNNRKCINYFITSYKCQHQIVTSFARNPSSVPFSHSKRMINYHVPTFFLGKKKIVKECLVK